MLVLGQMKEQINDEFKYAHSNDVNIIKQRQLKDPFKSNQNLLIYLFIVQIYLLNYQLFSLLRNKIWKHVKAPEILLSHFSFRKQKWPHVPLG